MKTIFISDIHGELEQLQKINLSKYDEIICLGDIYPYSYNEEKCNQVEKYLMNYQEKLICLKGNVDYQNEIIFTPTDYIKFNYDNIKIICTHGNKYNYAIKPPETFDVLIYGHEHYPSIKKIGNSYYICIGSISKPRNGSNYTYMIYENKTFTIYDIDGNIIEILNLKESI